MSDTEISAEVENAIKEIVDAELGRFGVEHVEAIDAEDADGDPAILVLIYYSSSDADPDPKITSGLITKINDRLYAMKERRFAHVAHQIPDQPREARRLG